MIKESYEKDCCASREMTVTELLESKKSNAIQQLAALDNALSELSRKDVSNETLKVVARLY